MKKLVNYLAYAANLAVGCVWAYALVWGIRNDAGWAFFSWSLLMILFVIENTLLRVRVEHLERD